MNRFFLVLIFFSSPLIIFSQDEMTDEEVLRGKEQLKQETEKKSEKKDSIPITDYKYFFSNGIEKSVDTTLTIYKDYKFNFIREDDFELLSFANVGHTYNKLGYNFNDEFKLPQYGTRGKHYSYYEIEFPLATQQAQAQAPVAWKNVRHQISILLSFHHILNC